MATYIESNDNFTKECFARKIYFFEKDVSFGQMIMSKTSPYALVKRAMEITDKLQAVLNKLSRTDYSLEKVLEYLLKLQKELSHNRLTMNELILIKHTMMSYLKELTIFISIHAPN